MDLVALREQIRHSLRVKVDGDKGILSTDIKHSEFIEINDPKIARMAYVDHDKRVIVKVDL